MESGGTGLAAADGVASGTIVLYAIFGSERRAVTAPLHSTSPPKQMRRSRDGRPPLLALTG